MADVHRLYPLSDAQEELDSAQVQLNALARALAQEALRHGPGGGNSGGMTGQATSIEGRLTRLEGAAVAAFVFLIVAFGSGYVLLSSQINAGTERLAGKLDGVSGSISKLQTDVAVLEERSSRNDPPPVSAAPRR